MIKVIVDAVFLGAGLSMDAAAVSMTNGMSEPTLRPPKVLLIALFYGVFQMLMPIIGYFAGSIFTQMLTKITPYLALVILGALGGKTLYEGIRHKNEPTEQKPLGLKTLTVQAVATSIDALAVGVVLVALSVTEMLVSVAVIGAITFILSVASVYIGKKLGGVLRNKAEIVGGIILIGIGLKIFLEGIL